MSTTTPNLNLTLPTPNVDTGWGSTLNTDLVLIDNLFSPDGGGTSIGVNVGNGKTLVLAGTMILGSGDNTGTVAPPTIRGAARTGTDVSGADITIKAANGTGTGGSGSFVFQTAPARSSGTLPCLFQNALVINGPSSPVLVDIGDGGTASTDGQSSLRINGSSAGSGTEGGSVFRIANNSVDTAAFGNRSAVFGGTTAYDSLTTLWGSQSLSFVVGSGTLAASNEKMRISDAGEISLWDATLATPALNPGVSGQVLTSTGPGTAATWSDTSINQVASQAFTSGGNSFTDLPPTIKSIIMSIRGLDPLSSADVLIRLQTSSGWITSGYQSSSSAVNSTTVQTTTNTTGFTINITGAVANGIIMLNNLGANTWVCNHSIGSTTARTCTGGGGIDLASELTGVQIIPQSGSFAASGFFNLMYL